MKIHPSNQEYRFDLQVKKKGVGLKDPGLGLIPNKKPPAPISEGVIVEKVDAIGKEIIPSLEVPGVDGQLPASSFDTSVEVLVPSVSAPTVFASFLSRGRVLLQSKAFLCCVAFAIAAVAAVSIYRWYTGRSKGISKGPDLLPATPSERVAIPPPRAPGLYLEKACAVLDPEKRQVSLEYSPAIEPPQESLKGKEVDVQLSFKDKEDNLLQVTTIDGRLSICEKKTIDLDPGVDLNKIKKIVDTVFHKEVPEVPKAELLKQADEQLKRELFEAWSWA